MEWHYIEFITRNSRMDGKRVQCFHRKGSTRVQHVEVSQTFTKWSNCCIHRGYVLSWLSWKMYSGICMAEKLFDIIFSTCWKFLVPVIVSEHYDRASGENSCGNCGMCFRFHFFQQVIGSFLRFVPYEFRTFLTKGYKTTKQICHIYIYIYIHKIHILLVVKFKFKAKFLQFPDALTFFGGVAKVPNSFSIMSNHHSKSVVLHVCVLFVSQLRFSSKRRTYPCRQSRDLFCKEVSWSVFCGSLQFFVWPATRTFSIIDLSTWNVPLSGASQTFIAHASGKLSHGEERVATTTRTTAASWVNMFFFELNLQL